MQLHDHKMLRLIAIMEGGKGLLALAVAVGVHGLIGQDIGQIVEHLVRQLHLNPASHYPSVVIHAASSLNRGNIMLVAGGAVLYSLVRWVEAYGLWHGYRWTEWFALVSGAIYLPAEIYELFTHTSLISLSILVINLGVVAYMALLLYGQKNAQMMEVSAGD